MMSTTQPFGVAQGREHERRMSCRDLMEQDHRVREQELAAVGGRALPGRALQPGPAASVERAGDTHPAAEEGAVRSAAAAGRNSDSGRSRMLVWKP